MQIQTIFCSVCWKETEPTASAQQIRAFLPPTQCLFPPFTNSPNIFFHSPLKFQSKCKKMSIFHKPYVLSVENCTSFPLFLVHEHHSVPHLSLLSKVNGCTGQTQTSGSPETQTGPKSTSSYEDSDVAMTCFLFLLSAFDNWDVGLC